MVTFDQSACGIGGGLVSSRNVCKYRNAEDGQNYYYRKNNQSHHSSPKTAT